MTAAALLARLTDLGVSAAVDGTDLRLRPASAIPGGLLADLKAHKAELLVLLAANYRDGWGLTAAKRAEGLTRVNARAEPTPDLPEPQRKLPQSLNQQIAAGYHRAALRRPPSWWRAEAHKPTLGATCSCCDGMRWWSRDECGWCCATCHPPNDATEAVREVRT